MSTTKTQQAMIAEDIEWSVVEGANTEFAAQYPRLQWIHGSKQAAGFMKTGGLFISKEQYPHFSGEGFVETTLITRKGDEIPGYAAPAAKLAVIRIKQQWVKDETCGRNVPLRQALLVIKGCDDLLCLSLRGAAKALDFQKAFNQHIGQNVALANRTRPENAPAIEPFALWFPLEAGAQHQISSKDGKSESAVTSPEMVVPENLDRNYIISLWVGATLYKLFANYYRETKAWQEQKIWEQRNGDDAEPELPTHSGNGITPEQADFIGGIIIAKKIDSQEVQEMTLVASNGATNNLKQLTREEAQILIDTAKAY